MEASSKVLIDVEILKPRRKLENILVIGKEPFSEKECIGIVGIGEKMNLEDSVYDAFQGGVKILSELIPTMSKNMIKSLLTLIGNSFSGQAFSKTSESTSIIVISKENIERVTKNLYKDFSKELCEIIFK